MFRDNDNDTIVSKTFSIINDIPYDYYDVMHKSHRF